MYFDTRMMTNTLLKRVFQTVSLTIFLGLFCHAAWAQSDEVLEQQRVQYDEVRAKTILELQPFRHETAVVLTDADTELRWVSMNPAINGWFLLQIGTFDSRTAPTSYHIENPNPTGQTVRLETGPNPTLILNDETGTEFCAPWADGQSALNEARETGLPFAPLCGGRLYLRNQVSGSRTSLERTAEFLRDHFWGGETIVRFVRDSFFRDSQFETSEELEATGFGRLAVGPGAAAIDAPLEERPVIATQTELGLSGTDGHRMTLGLWYPVIGLPGVFASAMQPKAISEAVTQGPGVTSALDWVEARAITYLVAFDLGRFDLNFALGTDHPGLGWSPRPPSRIRPRGVPGPDGINSPRPLVTLGMVNPALADRTVAVFTGGFKRAHGAFKWGDYISINFGTHYGFIENGTILSKLQPSLSTLYVLADGTIGMKTWTEDDNVLLPQIRFARQNGVPLLETDPETGLGVPGALVTRWGPGNWSGSADAKLRTLRAGACLRESEGERYLIYGYFSTATPSAMARTFQAYGCKYAMLLDMNALEHTYLALYVRHEGDLLVEHLVPGMRLIDKKARDGSLIPRFLGFVDNRDLFYLTLREE
ncbi:hypothetical protein ACFFUT_10405 [Pseudohalocynthiibacter aestuariivivens]|jgi:hypothetical protein|uniref:Uncharacterized protein n=2 Tax=Pseudohalocynthiibacter TaxID=1759417 RepID=A0ABV5JHF5_9RHOB|nr:hypothetical protein [Pseudohalocynthiibacter aestuariivivens]MBS9717767.1 hypothetical protein [Pseudohalocynthiibacter aestuariivivens]MCK0103083.1 hypothetical protein [Pseudohalocynthiibacter sp. F2068]